MAKYQKQFDLINEKKAEMEQMMDRLKNSYSCWTQNCIQSAALWEKRCSLYSSEADGILL